MDAEHVDAPHDNHPMPILQTATRHRAGPFPDMRIGRNRTAALPSGRGGIVQPAVRLITGSARWRVAVVLVDERGIVPVDVVRPTRPGAVTL